MLLSLSVHAEDIRYVSDKLSVPLRSGATISHRIVKFLSSGAALTVLETSEDGKFVRVQYSADKDGWIMVDSLMDAPSARVRLVTANKRIEQSKQQATKLNQAIVEQKSEIKNLKSENDRLQNERTNLNNSLDDIKITAANPLALSKKNKSLITALDKARANVAMLQKDNKRLASDVTQQWFMIGAGVSIGSLILGLILTRINWRRKRDDWGDSF